MTNPATDNSRPAGGAALGRKATFLFFATFGTTLLLICYTANVLILLHVGGTVERVRDVRLNSSISTQEEWDVIEQLGSLSWYLFFARIPLWLDLVAFPPLYYGLLALIYDLAEQGDFKLRTGRQICWSILSLSSLFTLLVVVIGLGFNTCIDLTQVSVLTFIGVFCLFSFTFIPVSITFSKQILGWNPDANEEVAQEEAPQEGNEAKSDDDDADNQTEIPSALSSWNSFKFKRCYTI